MSVKIQFSDEESALMLRAAEAGRGYYGMIAGADARMNGQELAALKTLIKAGDTIPAPMLQIICFGLERLFWAEDDSPKGIPALLAKLESKCSYKRLGSRAARIIAMSQG